MFKIVPSWIGSADPMSRGVEHVLGVGCGAPSGRGRRSRRGRYRPYAWGPANQSIGGEGRGTRQRNR